MQYLECESESVSHSVLPDSFQPMDCSLPASSVHRDSLGKNTWVGCQFLLQGIFPTQESNPGLPHCRQILYHLNHEGSHLVPPPGIRPEPPALEGQSLNHWTPREVPNLKHWKVVGNYMPNWFLFFLVWLYSIIIMVIGEIKMEF